MLRHMPLRRQSGAVGGGVELERFFQDEGFVCSLGGCRLRSETGDRQATTAAESIVAGEGGTARPQGPGAGGRGEEAEGQEAGRGCCRWPGHRGFSGRGERWNI